MRLLEINRGEDAESQVAEAPGDLQRTGAGHERLVQLAELRVDVRHERADTASPAVVVQALGESLGLAQALPHPPDFTEQAQHRPQLEADLEGLLQRTRLSGRCASAASARSKHATASRLAERSTALAPARRRWTTALSQTSPSA